LVFCAFERHFAWHNSGVLDLQVFNPIMIAVALVLMTSALIGLRRPKRIRLPRRRTFS